MAGKRFLFVSGDIGGAKSQVPVAKLLKSLRHEIAIGADGAGKGIDVWMQEKFDFRVINDIDEFHIEDLIAWSDLIFVSTCASATRLVEEVAKKCFGQDVPVVMGADGFFNHGFKKWQAVNANYWFAITKGHAQAIRALRPNLPPECIIVVGQPAFDSAMDLISRKEEIRLNRRNQLGIGAEKAALWWPTGMGELIEEDIEMVKAAIEQLSKMNTIFMMNGCHPKLENVRKGYIADIISRISDCCRDHGVKFINTQSMKIPLEELGLASDVILSITCTEDVKITLMGGPPVVHLLGPTTREWMENELLLNPPYYLPDVISGESLLVQSLDGIADMVEYALQPETLKLLRKNWQSPKERATERVAKELIALAR